MTDLDNQTSYWDAVAATKRFTHPLDAAWTDPLPREAQHRLIGELKRVLKPGGLLYVSDLVLGDDPRSIERYERFAETHDGYGGYGVFETSDGAVCRHHRADHFSTLLGDFDVQDTRRITVATMNGNEAAGIQLLARKSG
jgi:SAM-dependent methyltransferase